MALRGGGEPLVGGVSTAQVSRQKGQSRGTRRPAPRPALVPHLHFASFQSVEVLRSTFAAMARGAQVRTPALSPTATAPKVPTPAEARARGASAPRHAGGPPAVPGGRGAPTEGPGQGRGAPSRCPAARSCARRPATRLGRDMSGRRAAAPRPLGLLFTVPGTSGSRLHSGPGGGCPAPGDLLPACERRRHSYPSPHTHPGRAAGHPGTCSSGHRPGRRTRMHTCAPRLTSACAPVSPRAAALRRLGGSASPAALGRGSRVPGRARGRPPHLSAPRPACYGEPNEAPMEPRVALPEEGHPGRPSPVPSRS